MESAQPVSNRSVGIARFSVFQLDFSSFELRRRGQLVNLQQQPRLLLAYLIQHAGTVISREQLQEALWPAGTYVEFELGIYSVINRLRRELGDSSTRPQFIETVPKQGYRFIAHVHFEPAIEEFPNYVDVPAVDTAIALDTGHDAITRPEKINLPHTRRWIQLCFALAAALALAGTGWLAGRHYASAHAPLAGLYRYSLGLGDGEKLISLAISPAGDQIAYEAEKDGKYHIYRQYLDEDTARPIEGTEGGRRPFYSPDGKSLGFYTEGSLKVSSTTGVRQIAVISPDIEQWNAIWGNDGYIYFYAGVSTSEAQRAQRVAAPEPGTIATTRCPSCASSSEGIWRVSSSGGPVKPILHTTPGQHGVEFPFVSQLLTTNGLRLIYSQNSGQNRQSVRVLDLETGASRELVARGVGAFLLPGGQLIYFWRNSLYAVPMDIASLKPLGSPVEVLKNVDAFQWSGAKAAISRNGTLVYAKAPDLPLREIDWLDRQGRTTRLPIPPGAYEQAEVSPDGRRIAIVRKEEQSRWGLWIYNIKTAAWSPILQADVPRIRVLWSPDSQSIIASSNRDGLDFVNLVQIRMDAPDRIQRLTDQPYYSQFPQSWSPNGDAILFLEGVHQNSGSDIMLLPLKEKGAPQRLVATPNWEKSPTFSPAGDAIAFQTGRPENPAVRIQGYDPAAHRLIGDSWEVPDAQAHEPLWSFDGDRMFYLNAANDMVWVNPKSRGQGSHLWVPAIPKPPQDDWWTRPYSMSRDGRVLFIRALDASNKVPPRFQVVVNWTLELNRLCPIR